MDDYEPRQPSPLPGAREEKLLFLLRSLLSLGNLAAGGLASWSFFLIPKFERLFEDMLGDKSKLPSLSRAMIEWSHFWPWSLLTLVGLTLVGIFSPWISRRLDLLLLFSVVCCILLLAHFFAVLLSMYLPLITIVSHLGAP